MVSVLVPTLNERANMGELIERTLAAFAGLDDSPAAAMPSFWPALR